MALGEWLSVNSARELNAQQIATEANELAAQPEEEKQEMALIYEAKGLDPKAAAALAERLMSNKETALDTLVREELGIDPDDLGGSAWAAAGSSFLLFSAGAIFPVAPYFALHGRIALLASLGASAVALFLIGAGTSLFTGRGLLFSGARQVTIGLIAAAITYGIGTLLGVTLAG
jgi:VIT1/CCC1 family predicted Fe2+/Mn2+ transporter